jgi:sortase A
MIGTISIPAAHIHAQIGRGTSPAVLARGAGHYKGTAWPGHPGTIGLAGHDVTVVKTAAGDHVFGNLAIEYAKHHKMVGKVITIHFRHHRYRYLITKQKVVSPYDYGILKGPKYGQRLVLTTCYPRFTAAKRLVTIAWRIFHH